MCSTVRLLWASSPQGVWGTHFWGLGVVKHGPQGAHLYRLHNLQLEAWGSLVCVRASAAGLLFICRVAAWFTARVKSLRGCKALKGRKATKICVLLDHCRCFGAAELHHGYSSLTCTPMDEMNECSWIQSRNWIQCLPASLVQTSNYIQYYSKQAHSQKWVKDGPFHTK